MARGTVRWFDSKRGYGFILNKEEKDVFVHYTNLQGEGFRALSQGQMVEYEEFESERGLKSRNVRVVEEKKDDKSKTE